jgi:hypothetical protein
MRSCSAFFLVRLLASASASTAAEIGRRSLYFQPRLHQTFGGTSSQTWRFRNTATVFAIHNTEDFQQIAQDFFSLLPQLLGESEWIACRPAKE